MTDRPDLFVIGAPKCGTTAAHRYLSMHPDVAMAPRKDLHFFGSDLDFRGRPRLSEAEWRAAFPPRSGRRFLAEAGTWYLYSTVAAAEIDAACPRAHAVALLRDPVEAMHAHWGQLRYNAHGHEDLDRFADAIDAEGDRARGRRVPAGMPLPSALLYRRVFAYADQIERFLAVFGETRLHVVLTEDLKARPSETWGELLASLGLAPQPDLDLQPVNRAKAVRSERLRAALRGVPERWKVALPRRVRVGLRDRLRRLNTTRRARPALDPALRARLQAELRPDVSRLEGLLGRPLCAPAGPWLGEP